MDILEIFIIGGGLLIVLSAFFPKKKSLVNKYKKLNADNLAVSKSSAKKLNITFLVLAFLVIPVLMGFVMPKIGGTKIYSFILSTTVFSLLSCIAFSSFFQRCSKIIDSELRARSKG